MSEENKNLDDMADEAMDNAKEGAENLADKAEGALEDAKEKASELGEKASEKFDEAKEATKEFAEEAKEATKEFAEDAKEAANDFAEDVKETFSSDNPDSGKTVAIIAHITLIGWIIALVMNNGNKTEIGSFYIRQVLGIMLLGFVLGIIPVVNLIAWIVPFVLWIISLVGAFGGKQKPVLLVGDYFQDWFKSL
ncbi:MAG: hypothetical protein Mars2KO_20820 [Maribacter sp.]|uniref:YtxH domain-containing protein n=1 Tax=Maribacter sp. 2307UL18-2 TaxID=3386274 RepID=UPI0039BCF481